MKKGLFICLLMLSSAQLFAQQDAIFSHYFFNPLFVNPAYAGSREALSFVGVARQQWVGIEGAPSTQAVTVHGLVKEERIGLGGHMFNDRVGPMSQSGLVGSFAYRINFEEGIFAMGIQAAIYQIGVRWDQMRAENNSDGSIMDARENRIHPDANFGIYYYTDNYYAGISLSHLIGNKLGMTPDYERVSAAKFFKHYFIMGGMVLPVNDKIDFRPSTMIKFVKSAPIDLDLFASFLYMDKVWAGLGLRTSRKSGLTGFDNQALFVLEYVIKNKVRLGYAHDWMLNQLGSQGASSHEVMIGFDLNKGQTNLGKPRYF